MKYVIALLIIVIGMLVYLIYLTELDPDDYHELPVAAFLDEGLYGDKKALEDLELLKPFVYLQEQLSGGDRGYYLNVLIPCPDSTSVELVSMDAHGGTMEITYEAASDHPTGLCTGLYHQTLIPVEERIDTIVVQCRMVGGGSGETTVLSDDTDPEDPIDGGSATPYMNGAMKEGLMVYNGGASCVATVMRSDRSTLDYSIDGTPDIQCPGVTGAFEAAQVDRRRVKGVH